jgi:glutamate-1-semialdehyde 2,1-aminomutase
MPAPTSSRRFDTVPLYDRGRERSRELWEQASGIFPMGVNGAAKFFAPHPVFIASAQGSRVTDVDGNTYVDLLLGAGPALFGHNHPRIVEAVREQVARMTNPMMPIEESTRLGERIRGHMPYLERLRFVNTGSEATRSAIRVARAVTGRPLIGKFEGNFHGSDDPFLISTHMREPAGTDDRPQGTIDYAGLTPGIAEEVLILPYNNAEAAVALIEEHGDRLAGVIMEPVAFSSGGGVPATKAFAAAVRAVTERHGIVLIFDEVLCAYRMGMAGAPAYLDVTPDLATIGKAVGGGMPLGAFGGRSDLMGAALGAHGAMHIFQSGTFTENPVSIAAGHAALDVLESEPILERANAAGAALREGLQQVFDEQGIPALLTGQASVFQVHLGATEIRNRRDVLQRSDLGATRDFLLGMVAKGVLWPPVHPAVTSGAHTDEDVELVVAAAAELLDEVA